MTAFCYKVALLWCLFLNPARSILERKIWFDKTCVNHADVNVNELWNTVREMKANAREAAAGSPNPNLYQYIFKGQNIDFIKSTLDAISADLAANVEESNTVIYCDEDERFTKVPQRLVGGNSIEASTITISWDSITPGDIVYRGEKTKCSLSKIGRPVLGGTYCNENYTDKKRCSITLCDSGIRFKSKLSRGGLEAYRKQQADFSKIMDGALDDGRPPIDHWNLLDTIILHEITHTIHNENDFSNILMWDDKAYGWKEITTLSAKLARLNADSLAYLGLGSWIQTSASGNPYTIQEDGNIRKS